MIATKGKRKVEFQGETYYWWVRDGENSNPVITISSPDKSLRLSHSFDPALGIGSSYIKELLAAHFDEEQKTKSP